MKIIIPGESIDLNTYIRAERSNRFLSAKIKKNETERVMYHVLNKHIVRNYPVKITFFWYTKDLRVDADNVAFAKKFILDGLVSGGVLKDDSRKYVSCFGGDFFEVDKQNPRCEILIEVI